MLRTWRWCLLVGWPASLLLLWRLPLRLQL